MPAIIGTSGTPQPTSTKANPRAEKMDTGMGNRAFENKHPPAAFRDALAGDREKRREYVKEAPASP